MINDLFTQFNKYFEIIPASSPLLKLKVYELRYQIYCLETGFENPFDFPDEIETDSYDKHSEHYIIRHRNSDSYIATTRLILPSLSSAERKFPIELFTTIDNTELLHNIPRDCLGETSRFCVSKSFKKRKYDDSSTLTGVTNNWELSISKEERRTYPLITIVLMSCTIKMCHDNNIFYCYAVMEPALVRFFKSIGVIFKVIGPAVDYHGTRVPCIISFINSSEEILKSNPEIWYLLTNDGQYFSDNSKQSIF